ncbi:hypothetical protein [Ideonella sp.]|uniref:hypothetical protein n=1 Tax=Ideonella sp. TaxID=1929293 RepID=UPI003BB5D4E4
MTASPTRLTTRVSRPWHRQVLPWLLAGKAITLIVMAAVSLGGASRLAQAQTLPAAEATAPAAVQSAFVSFQKAAQGDEAATDEAATAFAKLSAAAPGNAVLLAYAGASHAMLARSTLLPWKKMGYADDGLAQIDKALALLTPAQDAPLYRGVPAALDVKFTAASTFMALPGLFHRQERGHKLLAEVASSPLLKSCPAAFQASVAVAQQKAKGN